jgi:hypothetical protein
MSPTRSRAVAVAVAVEEPLPAPDGPVEALRRRLGGSAREHVVLDFLEDDLREARAALSGVASYLANVDAALADPAPSRDRLLSLAIGGGPIESVDDLAQLLSNVRRRLAQVAARM